MNLERTVRKIIKEMNSKKMGYAYLSEKEKIDYCIAYGLLKYWIRKLYPVNSELEEL